MILGGSNRSVCGWLCVVVVGTRARRAKEATTLLRIRSVAIVAVVAMTAVVICRGDILDGSVERENCLLLLDNSSFARSSFGRLCVQFVSVDAHNLLRPGEQMKRERRERKPKFVLCMQEWRRREDDNGRSTPTITKSDGRPRARIAREKT